MNGNKAGEAVRANHSHYSPLLLFVAPNSQNLKRRLDVARSAPFFWSTCQTASIA